MKTPIEEESFKRLCSRTVSRKSGALTTPLLDAERKRIPEHSLVNTYDFQAIPLAVFKTAQEMNAMEKGLQTALQSSPFGIRLWSSPSSAGRPPLSTTQLSYTVYFSFSLTLQHLLREGTLLLNEGHWDERVRRSSFPN